MTAGISCRYVLLKERNMLLTLRHEANRHRFIMPAPERLKKVLSSVTANQKCFLILFKGKTLNGSNKSCNWRKSKSLFSC